MERKKLDTKAIRDDVKASNKHGFKQKLAIKLADQYDKLEKEEMEFKKELEAQKNKKQLSKEEKRKQLIKDIIGYGVGILTGIALALLLTKLGGK